MESIPVSSSQKDPASGCGGLRSRDREPVPGSFGPVSGCHLALEPRPWHPGIVDEEAGIYRGEVIAIMGALADVAADTAAIRAILSDEDDDDEEAEEKDT